MMLFFSSNPLILSGDIFLKHNHTSIRIESTLRQVLLILLRHVADPLKYCSERLRAMQLKSQLEKLQSQRQKSVQRNQMIRRQMTEFDANLINVSATTQRLRALKVVHMYNCNNTMMLLYFSYVYSLLF